MEYFDGIELDQYIQARQKQNDLISDKEAREIVTQLLEAVKYLHANNITHRDIKPENILIKETVENGGRKFLIKLIDFGLSYIAEHIVAHEHDNCGTLIYMSPEMALEKEYNNSVDIWGVGIIQYLLLSMNRHPLKCDQNETKESYIKKLEEVVWDFPENMNEKAQNFFLKACSISYVNRFSAQQALLHTWITGEGKLTDPITLNDMFKLYDEKQNLIQMMKAMLAVQIIKKKCQEEKLIFSYTKLLKSTDAPNSSFISDVHSFNTQTNDAQLDSPLLNLNLRPCDQDPAQITQLPSSRSVTYQRPHQSEISQNNSPTLTRLISGSQADQSSCNTGQRKLSHQLYTVKKRTNKNVESQCANQYKIGKPHVNGSKTPAPNLGMKSQQQQSSSPGLKYKISNSKPNKYMVRNNNIFREIAELDKQFYNLSNDYQQSADYRKLIKIQNTQGHQYQKETQVQISSPNKLNFSQQLPPIELANRNLSHNQGQSQEHHSKRYRAQQVIENGNHY